VRRSLQLVSIAGTGSWKEKPDSNSSLIPPNSTSVREDFIAFKQPSLRTLFISVPDRIAREGRDTLSANKCFWDGGESGSLETISLSLNPSSNVEDLHWSFIVFSPEFRYHGTGVEEKRLQP
jgi:hypothetical protein